MITRRTFTKQMSIMIGALHLPTLPHFSTEDWPTIQSLYSIDRYPYLHLNSGSAGILPNIVEQQVSKLASQINQNPPYEFWDSMAELRYKNLSRLSSAIGSTVHNTAVVRNTTEALNLVIFGFPFSKGDGVLTADIDYPYAVGSIKQVAKRYELKHTEIQLQDIDSLSDDELIARYAAAIIPGTKLVLLSYVAFREGRVLPVRAIADIAHSRGAEVVLDAAHAYAHFTHSVIDLDVDYYATSLHKWLSSPHGTGLLYIKDQHIAKLCPPQPLMDDNDNILKFSHLGTRAFQQELGINYALTFQDVIGFDKKEARLFALTKYWTDAVKSIPGVTLHTPIHKDHCGAVAAMNLAGRSNIELTKTLFEKYSIHVKPVGYPNKSYLRVSPNLFTLESDLDRFVEAIHTESKA